MLFFEANIFFGLDFNDEESRKSATKRVGTLAHKGQPTNTRRLL